MPLAITPTFSPWTHTSDDSYIYQLSLVLATATVSFNALYTILMKTSRVTTDGFLPITPWISDDEGVSDVAKHYWPAR